MTPTRAWRANRNLAGRTLRAINLMNRPEHLAQLGEVRVRVDHETAVISNANATIGYATYSNSDGTLDYIYVIRSFRRMGVGSMLVALCEQESGRRLLPMPPISPLGRQFFAGIGRDARAPRQAVPDVARTSKMDPH